MSSLKIGIVLYAEVLCVLTGSLHFTLGEGKPAPKGCYWQLIRSPGCMSWGSILLPVGVSRE